MSTFRGLPAHVLLVHGLVVLVPLTAALLVLCALWPAARRRFVWLTAVLAVAVVVLTPLTTTAGEWLRERLGGGSPAIEEHANLGDDTLFYIVPLVVAAALVALVHVRAGRNRPVGRAALALVAIVAIAAGTAATVHTYRVGDSGSRAVWTGVVT
ncbi:DUF2231 domain-containing protein [Nocardia sp. NPDC057668]|uniref:DUF2231 domain-containing protein n=1 Tax=Nocardia sp. NPDC057668 TaxID=3346202 RepID=UPI00366F4D7A